MKNLEQLLDKQSAWLILRDWFTQAKNHYEILASYPEDAGSALVGMQLSTRSPLGQWCMKPVAYLLTTVGYAF